MPVLKLKSEHPLGPSLIIETDVVFTREGIRSTRWLIEKCDKFPRLMREMVVYLKLLLKKRNLNSTWHGGVGSFLLAVMVGHFLERHADKSFVQIPQLVGFLRGESGLCFDGSVRDRECLCFSVVLSSVGLAGIYWRRGNNVLGADRTSIVSYQGFYPTRFGNLSSLPLGVSELSSSILLPLQRTSSSHNTYSPVQVPAIYRFFRYFGEEYEGMMIHGNGCLSDPHDIHGGVAGAYLLGLGGSSLSLYPQSYLIYPLL